MKQKQGGIIQGFPFGTPLPKYKYANKRQVVWDSVPRPLHYGRKQPSLFTPVYKNSITKYEKRDYETKAKLGRNIKDWNDLKQKTGKRHWIKQLQIVERKTI